jgi:DNA-binding transcriptional LysR family regulator
MDLNDVLVFVRVVQAGSFTAAAHALDLTKSSVSRKVTELEDRLGARLLSRSTRTLRLTDVGRAYYADCARIIGEIEEAELAVTRMQTTPRGLLRLSVPLAFAPLGAVIAEYLSRYPDVRAEIVATDRQVNLVDEGFDLAIRVGPLADSTLIARPLGAIKRMLVASPSYLARRGRPRKPADLERHPCLVFTADGWTLRAGKKSVGVAPPARLVVNDFELLREAALGGLGVASLPEHVCRDDLRRRRVRRVLPEWCTDDAQIHAVYPSTRHLTPKVTACLDMIVSFFATVFPTRKR